MSRWANWSTGTEAPKLGFGSFMQINESGQPLQGDPEQIIQQNGWEHRGYGYYVDSSGQTVARMKGGQLYAVDDMNDAEKQIDQGNPTSAASGMKPADRARAMGLRSNGRGGYLDPNSGQVVARTVNNELVFYDNGPGGGAVSDGAGGQNVAMAQPSWQDPVSGLIIVPPSKPESPAEIAAVPDPVPSQAPAGFHSFIQQAKMKAYRNDARMREIDAQQSEVDQIYQSHPAMGDLQIALKQTIQKAEESGDEYKMDIATRVTDLMNNNAEQYKEYFDIVPEEQHMELMDNLKKYTIQKAKRDAYESSDEKQEHDLLTDKAENGEEIDRERAKELIDKMGRPEKYEYAVNTMVDEASGFNDTDLFRNESDETKVVEGDKVKYFLEPFKSAEYDEGQLEEIQREVFNVAKEYGVSAPQGAIDVAWDTKDDPEGMAAPQRKSTALDALKTWRNQVLPTLNPGLMLRNVPSKGGRGNNQRERMYVMAGFGSANELMGGQYGVVVQDENGNNMVAPLEFGLEEQALFNNRLRRLAEPLWYANLNTSQMTTFAEAIFHGL